MKYAELGRLAQAVRGIPLTEILPHLEAMPDRQDKARWKTPNGVISVTGMRFYDWHRQAGGGGAIDLVMHVRKLDFKSAVFWLRDVLALPTTTVDTMPAPPRVFRPPAPCERNLPLAIHYLERQRCVPETVLAPLIRNRRIYADHRANAVFLLQNPQGQSVGAELRGTTRVPWRGMAPGSCKATGFFAAGPEDADSVVLCESAIDALSCHALHPAARAISTAGATPHPAWLSDLIATGKRIACGFDTDDAGENAAQTMIARHPAIGRLRPSRHDWNDDLRAPRPV